MNLTHSIVNFRRHLKRRSCSTHTVRSYLNNLKQFVVWVDEPIESVTHHKIGSYIDHLLKKRLAPKTINCHLISIRRFYDFLRLEEDFDIANPVRKGCHLRQPRPLPKHLKDDEVKRLLAVVDSRRDRAIIMLMLRSGLRVGEVVNLTLTAFDWSRRRLYIHNGKGGKDRVVYISPDTYRALSEYIQNRPTCRTKRLFLVERGRYKKKPISIRGVQKRMEAYAKAAGLNASCHHLRHTMATQLLNADADLVTIQDMLGHSQIKTTQRYCKVCNLKVQKDYFKAMDRLLCENEKSLYLKKTLDNINKLEQEYSC
jgi:site-specific recombinase XerD